MRYIISDLHLGHKNIIKYCNRPFSSVEEMDNTIITNWNMTVRKDDEVYFLGDFCFGRPGQKVSREYREKLNGKIHLILGNHDKYIDKSCFESVQNYLILNENDKKILLYHYPIHREDFVTHRKNIPNYDICFYGHVHNHDNQREDLTHRNMSIEKLNYVPLNFDYSLSCVENEIKIKNDLTLL